MIFQKKERKNVLIVLRYLCLDLGSTFWQLSKYLNRFILFPDNLKEENQFTIW